MLEISHAPIAAQFLDGFVALPRSSGLAGGALAASGDWSRNDHVEMRLISAVEAVGDRETLPLGLQFRMKPGWKLYWRTPGDAGFPPRPVWQGSENIADVVVQVARAEALSPYSVLRRSAMSTK